MAIEWQWDAKGMTVAGAVARIVVIVLVVAVVVVVVAIVVAVVAIAMEWQVNGK